MAVAQKPLLPAGCLVAMAGPTLGIVYGLHYYSRDGHQELSVGFSFACWGALWGLVAGLIVTGLCALLRNYVHWFFVLATMVLVGASGALFGWGWGDRKSFEERADFRLIGVLWGTNIGAGIGFALAFHTLVRFRKVNANPNTAAVSATTPINGDAPASTHDGTDEAKAPILSPVQLQVVRGLWQFIAAGAITGLCIGLLYFSHRLDRGALPITLGLMFACGGAVASLLLGAVLWGIAQEFPKLLRLLRVISIVWLLSSIVAGIGWRLGVSVDGLLDQPLGMRRGAIVGAVAALLWVIIRAIPRPGWDLGVASAATSESETAPRSEDSASRLNDSGS
jgi:hypothetical protein